MNIPLLSFQNFRRDCSYPFRQRNMAAHFSLVRLSSEDATRQSDHLRILGGMLLENEPMYPGIKSWYVNKVVPGLKSSQRVA